MSKKVLLILGGIILISFGVVIGSKNTDGPNEYFEMSKNEVEEQIKNNEEIKTKNLYPEADKTTKLAQNIDQLIMKIISVVKNKIGSN